MIMICITDMTEASIGTLPPMAIHGFVLVKVALESVENAGNKHYFFNVISKYVTDNALNCRVMHLPVYMYQST